MEMVDFQEFCKLYRALPERERNVIMWRFGLDGQGTRTLEVIGNQTALPRERVRIIEREALKKLKL